jgi:hypothetical protein
VKGSEGEKLADTATAAALVPGHMESFNNTSAAAAVQFLPSIGENFGVSI